MTAGQLPAPPRVRTAAEAARALAVGRARLQLHAQPIVDTQTGAVAGYEVLTRLPPAWGLGPLEVFEAAEHIGVSAALTTLVLRRSLRLRDVLPPRTFLTVNCSPADIVAPEVGRFLAGADLRRVVVELTETAWPEDETAVLDAAALVRERGGRIAADDVGAGYAGLLQLVRLRPEIVKVDRAIVQRVDTDVAVAALISMLGELVGALDGWLVAEGVETRGQLEQLVQLGVPLVQGYLLARPGEPWPACDLGDDLRELHARAGFPEHLVAHHRSAVPGEVVTTPDGVPTGVNVTDVDGHLKVVRPLTMAPSTPVEDAVRRAMARPTPCERIAPLLLTDVTGRLTGVVPVERLVEVLLNDR
jgi:EAL domain-containing protein (putative c-di-GMP-specific phosphodiesterase class I)